MAESDVKFRQIDLSAEIKKIWGRYWNAPENAYVMSNGRVFQLRTEDASAYADYHSIGEPLLEEFTAADVAAANPTENFYILQENGEPILQE